MVVTGRVRFPWTLWRGHHATLLSKAPGNYREITMGYVYCYFTITRTPIALPPAHSRACGDFGFALQQVRMSRGLTQEELATLVGVPQSTVSQMESGKATKYLYRLLALAEATGLEFQATLNDHT